MDGEDISCFNSANVNGESYKGNCISAQFIVLGTNWSLERLQFKNELYVDPRRKVGSHNMLIGFS